MKDQAADKRSALIAGAVTLTVVFLGAFGWLLSRTDTCKAGWWLWDRFACLEPNAIGDTFAGAFAPVAFVWLVAAVMLQRNELAAQRQELRESRAVAAQQVEEAKKNVELIGIQTGILRDERAAKIEKDADEDLGELIETAAKIFNQIVQIFSVSIGPVNLNAENKPWDPEKGVYSMAGPYIEPGIARLGQISQQIIMISVVIIEAVHNGEEIRFKGFYHFDKLHNILFMIDDVIKRVSAPTKAELVRASALGTSNDVDRLMKYLKDKGINMDEADTIF